MPYKIGDIVQLKSGSPKMTVVGINGNTVHTSWFAGQKNERAVFDFNALEPATLEAKK